MLRQRADSSRSRKPTWNLCFCRFTQLGLLRLLTNPKIMEEEVMTQRSAWAGYRRWFEDVRFGVSQSSLGSKSSCCPTAYNLFMIEYADASAEVRAVYDDIMATRQIDWINNFWKALAHDPATLRRTWESIKQVMAPGALDPLTKEMVYLAVSASNQCPYCIASHTAAARKAGMSDAMFGELMAVVGMANETNRLASGYQVEIDERFRPR
jgi:AhpD family alkylhydroperoxidase